MSNILRHFDWSEFVDRAVATPADWNGYVKVDRSNDTFAGCSFDDAVLMARGPGYKQALPAAEELAGKVEQTVAAELFQTTFTSSYAVTGAEVDMGRFLSGEPECMIESEPIRISRQGRAVRIGVPVCFSASVSNSTILARGAAVMALVDILGRAQHPLEVWAGVAIGTDEDRTEVGYGRSGGRLCYMVNVQRASEPLDPGRLMYALAHPSMLRQLGFASEEHENASHRKEFSIGRSYGFSGYGLLESDFQAEGGNTIILPELRPGADWSEGAAVRWIEEQIATIFAG